MSDTSVCNDGRPLRPCPCGDDRCYTCDPQDGDTLEQRIKDTIRATRCRYERGQDHPDEPKRVEDAVPQAVAALMQPDPETVCVSRNDLAEVLWHAGPMPLHASHAAERLWDTRTDWPGSLANCPEAEATR